MGMIVEFNWFMVVSNEESIKDENNYKFTIKSDKRIYPIGFLLPLIVKKQGCIGMIKIVSTLIEQNQTKIVFDIVETFDKESPVARHYYDRYLDFKKRENEINP